MDQQIFLFIFFKFCLLVFDAPINMLIALSASIMYKKIVLYFRTYIL